MLQPAPLAPARAPCSSPNRYRRAAAPPRAAPSPTLGFSGTQPTSQEQLSLLKEWAVTCAAQGDGSQTILLRKGGIKEPLFKPQARSFLLFPTLFHTEAQLLKPGMAEKYAQEMVTDPKALPAVPLRHWATITGAWTTTDPRVLQQLQPLHVWSESFLDVRLKWRAQQPITLLELRCYNLPQHLQLPTAEDLWGCFSWLEVPGSRLQLASSSSSSGSSSQSSSRSGSSTGAVLDVLKGAVPALSDAAFAEKQALLRQGLQQLQAEPLEL